MKKLLGLLILSLPCWAQSVTLPLSCPAYRAPTLVCVVSLTGTSLIPVNSDKPAAFQFVFNADPRTPAWAAAVTGTAAAAGKTIQCANGICIVSGVNGQVVQDGPVVQISITIPSSTTGNMIYSLSSPIGASLAGNGVTTTVNPPLSVPSVNKCDITGDGLSDVADDAAIKIQILSGTPPLSSDLNKDGAVNVIDEQIIINAAQGRGCTAQ